MKKLAKEKERKNNCKNKKSAKLATGAEKENHSLNDLVRQRIYAGMSF